MLLYTQRLIEEGITSPFRAEKVAEAMLALHEALSRLDIQNLQLLLNSPGQEKPGMFVYPIFLD